MQRNLLARAGSNGNAERRGSLRAGKTIYTQLSGGGGVTERGGGDLERFIVLAFLTQQNRSLTSSIPDLLFAERLLIKIQLIFGTGPLLKVPSFWGGDGT